MQILEQLAQKGIVATRLTVDSRQVQPGDVFVALPGSRVDGRTYIAQAMANGAAAVIAEAGKALGTGAPCVPENPLGEQLVPTIEVDGLSTLSGEIANLVYGRPSEHLWLAGVTGTNGKTSVSQWIAQALNSMPHRCAVIGTLGNGFLETLEDSPNTTPDAISLHAALASYVAGGAEACAMEISSIGLDQGRVNGAAIDVAIYTNLTRDHLEYHGTMAAYAAAKEKLFMRNGLAAAVLNLDDAFGRELAGKLKGRVPTIGYTLGGVTEAVDETLYAKHIRMSARGVEFNVGEVVFSAPVVGRFNISNLLAVVGALRARGENLEAIARAIRHIQSPPGRMQAIGGTDEPLVIVDYAHTPDALEKALGVLRETAGVRGGRLICVFGCGGDRDSGKRPAMGAVAERLADVVVLTSDNPRGEDSQAIIDDILAGLQRRPFVQAERGQAIVEAVSEASSQDVILIAGKGHEPYQEIAGVRHPFSDLDAAKSALAGRQS